jgi:hypothetical protein
MVEKAIATLSHDVTPALHKRLRGWFNTDDPDHISGIKNNFERL